MFNLGEKTTSYETFIRLLNNIYLCTFQLLLEGLKNIYVTEKNFYFADEIKIIFTRKNAFNGKFFIMLNNDHYKSVLNSAKFKKKYFLNFIRCNKIWLLNAIIRVFYCLNFFAIHVYVYWYWTNSNFITHNKNLLNHQRLLEDVYFNNFTLENTFCANFYFHYYFISF